MGWKVGVNVVTTPLQHRIFETGVKMRLEVNLNAFLRIFGQVLPSKLNKLLLIDVSITPSRVGEGGG